MYILLKSIKVLSFLKFNLAIHCLFRARPQINTYTVLKAVVCAMLSVGPLLLFNENGHEAAERDISKHKIDVIWCARCY